ncbi:MAG: GGDEF domain-containing protein [Clostridiales bacterium]|nr:GGDEF domain-containing protein [Clostridiales bacterium]
MYLLMALIGLVFFVLIDAGLYYYFVNTSLSASPILASHYGMMFFVVTLLMSIPNYISEFVNERNEKLVFKHLAFTDALTSLGNRARCEDVVKSLILNEVDFTFIIFDLNYLKRVNDSLGHKAGDALLCGFADALTACFPLSPAICRIGGDEFALILPYADKAKLKIDMDNYEKCIVKKSEEIGLSLSAAYGIARSDEMKNPCWEGVFRMADARMYEMKSEMHKKEFCK